MPTLNINGQRVKVDDSFLTLPLDQQSATVDEIAAKMGTKPPAAETRDLPTIRNSYLEASKAGNRPIAEAQADAYVRREKADSPIITGISDRVRQIAKGVPILGGAADEINAGLAAITGGDYNEALDYQRARDRVFEADRPKESTALQIGGGVTSALATIPLAAGGAAAQGASRIGLALKGAATGAAVGAPDGFLRGEGGFGDRAQNAAISGVLGGVVGGAAPTIVNGIGTGLKKASDTFSTNKILGGVGLSRPAGDVVNRALMADDALMGSGLSRIESAGPGAMIADAGPTMSGILDTVVQSPGRGALIARRAIDERAADANRSISGALNKSLGSPMGLDTAENAIRTGSSAARRGTYESAYAQPVNYVDKTGRGIEDLLRQVPGDVISRANRLMQLKGEQSQQILANIADDGSVTFKQMPDVRQLDYITRALNDAAKAGDGAGALGGQTAMGSAYQSLARNVRSLLRENVPAYGEALDTAADAISRREALQTGASLLSPKTTRDEIANLLSGMSVAEKNAVKQGVRSQIDDAVANVTRAASDPNIDAREATKAFRDLSSKSARDKIAQVIGETSARDLFTQMNWAGRALELRAATATNSRTFGRQMTKEAIDQATEPGAVGTLMQGQPVNAGRKLVQSLLGTGPEVQAAKGDEIRTQIAKVLTGPRGNEARDFVKKIEDAYRRKGASDKAAEAIAQIAGAMIAGGANPAMRQLLDLPR